MSLPQAVLYDVLLLKTLGVHPQSPKSLQLTSAVIVTRPDQGVEQAGIRHLKGSDKPVV